MFDIPLFSKLFEKAPAVKSEKEILYDVLNSHQQSEEEKEERARLIELCNTVMRAEKYEDVDISLEDLVKLATVYEDVKDLYCENGSGSSFLNYSKRMKEAPSVLRRRVL